MNVLLSSLSCGLQVYYWALRFAFIIIITIIIIIIIINIVIIIIILTHWWPVPSS